MTACCLSTLRDWGHTDCPQPTFPVRTPPRMVTQPLPQPRGRWSWHKAPGHCPPHPHPAGGPGRPGGPCIPLSPPEETQALGPAPGEASRTGQPRRCPDRLDGSIWPRAPAGQCLHKTPGPICKGTGWPLAQDPSARVTMPLEGRQLAQQRASDRKLPGAPTSRRGKAGLVP
ncbi:translation initiation factor IF-2-like isoform X2 [Felis catus]|uniref:translation initiation factor IF-2-like isoform X2 n=1 Tax=Felis catus TaxID=9685 RepID=UPI001D19FF11|nr:translation initiation factor IF-2-like isoform X2 [Felis catus]